MTSRPPRPLPAFVLAGLCAAGAVADIAYLASGAAPVATAVALGPLPGGITLALDGLSGFFLLIVLVAATASAAAATALGPAGVALLAAFVVGMAMCLTAGDGLVLLAGTEVMSAAALMLVLTGDRQAAMRFGGVAIFGALCLIGALGLLASSGLSFAAMRAHPPHGLIATAIFVLTLLGAGAAAGFVPLHGWLPSAHAAAPAPAGALMAGAMTSVALYVLARVLLDLCGPVQPMAWGAALMLIGAAGAVLGAARANFESDLNAALAGVTIANVGMIATGIGVALAARAADLPALSSLAVGAALLQAMAYGLLMPLLFLAAGAVQQAAGSRELDCLGGLIQRMPVTTACVLVGAASLAALPPSAGFAGVWLLLQSVFAAPRIGGLAFQAFAGLVAAALAFAAALAAAAAVRMVGIGFLGRPRTPRGASAQDAPRSIQAVLIGLAGLLGVLGLLPFAALALAAPALHQMLGDDFSRRAGVSALRTQPAEGAVYVPWAVALMLVLAAALIVTLARRRAQGGVSRVPAWNGGLGPPPPWLPFGDPATQGTAAGQSRILRRTLRWSRQDRSKAHVFQKLATARLRLAGWAEALQALTALTALQVLFAVVVAALAALVVL